MDITITINCDNAAFEDDPGELARILSDLSKRIIKLGYGAGDFWVLRDIDGNRVGLAKMSGEMEEL